MSLDNVRLEIDAINKEMGRLFNERMKLAKKVAENKLEHNIPILNEKREQEIIDSYGDNHYSKQFFKSLMEISRSYQTRILLRKNIVLIGMMGCGKTTVGKLISDKLGIPFTDIDENIENKQGMSITDIFNNGEDGFRTLETAEIETCCSAVPQVISTGGGIVKNKKNIDLLRESGIIFFLNRPIKSIAADIDLGNRPMLQGDIENVFKVYNQRHELYRQSSDYEINAVTPEQTADEIINLLQQM